MGRKSIMRRDIFHGISVFLLVLIGHFCFAHEEKKACYGTNNRFNQLGSVDEHYSLLQRLFNNCEVVHGNLEIANLQPNHNTDFLKSIREVDGYVLIGINSAKTILLENLEIIRGNTLYKNKYALVIVSNNDQYNSLEELPLSHLTEILKGGVLIGRNKKLCNINTIQWKDIVNSNYLNSITLETNSSECTDTVCDASCNGSCWGPGPENCQSFTKLICAPHCPGRCRGPSPSECCHSECASGCAGPTERDCLHCRNFRDGDVCKDSCPPLQKYNTFTFQLEHNPAGKYSFGTTCVKKCPYNYAVIDSGSCVRACAPDSEEVDENGVRKCRKCDGPCRKDKVCDGIGTGMLRNVLSLNASNIDMFKNCTKINGDLRILIVAGDGDAYTKTAVLDPEKLLIFETLREITGYLMIQWWPQNYSSLKAFENLEIIRGRTKEGDYSLVINSDYLKSLGLRSLKELSDGNVYIKGNNSLCFADTLNWKNLFRENQEVKIKNLKSPEECAAEGNVCDELCTNEGCWGPGPSQCFTCKFSSRGKECVKTCNILTGEPSEYDIDGKCYSCHPECLPRNDNITCTGPGPDDCMRCLNYKDGPYCVQKCPAGYKGDNDRMIWKYPDEDNKCQLCHPECKLGCTGPGIEGCIPCD
ncbi:epidermal growth factor receptor [Bombina bombina]|uniref:epidermal growth factor receptor n=1 Tax=Bombina bombina TaxID=8345 RepID=UPI00235ACBA9|nr:epidermal growth factor receptor [Bombina bombina]